jgi:hypothetical protein
MKTTGKSLTTRTELHWCPVCFYRLDACTSLLDEIVPGPGDFTVCLGCASVLRFTGAMDFEVSSLESIPIHSRLPFARVVQAVKEKPQRAYRIT